MSKISLILNLSQKLFLTYVVVCNYPDIESEISRPSHDDSDDDSINILLQDDYDDNAHKQTEDKQSETTPTLTSISPTNASDSHPSLTKKDNAMEQYSRITPEKGKYVIMLIFIFYCTV